MNETLFVSKGADFYFNLSTNLQQQKPASSKRDRVSNIKYFPNAIRRFIIFRSGGFDMHSRLQKITNVSI